MKKFLYAVIIVLAIAILADRLLKVYEKTEAARETGLQRSANPVLTAKQLEDYAAAAEYRLMPYMVFGLKPNFRSDTVNVNSLGLRGGEIKKKKESCYRIVVIGGSAVFGGSVPGDEMTFCGLLEKDLKIKYGKNIEVINAGVPAFISMQELILLEDKIIAMEPDMIVIFDGFNDVLTILKREKRPNYPWWFSEIERIYYKSITKLFLEKRLQKYRPTKHILKWINKMKEKTRETRYDINTEQIAFYRRNLDLMCHLAGSYGIKVVLVFQPVIMYKEFASPAEREMISSLDQDYLEALVKMCDLAKVSMREVARDNNVSFIDGTKFFNGSKEYIFIDEVHFNQRGNKIVADLLADRIFLEAPGKK